jgi:hypothetical protein
VESKQATGLRPSMNEATNIHDSLAARWNETEGFNRPVDPTLTNRFRQSQDWLQHRMKAGSLRKRRILISVTLVVLAAVGAAIPHVMDWIHQRDFLRRAAALESTRDVSGMEALAAGLPPRLKTKPQVVASLAKARDFLAQEEELKQAFDKNFSGLQRWADGGYRIEVEQPGARLAQCEGTLAKLAPEYQPARKSALLAWDAKWQPVRNAALATRLDRAEPIAAGLQGSKGYDAVRATLDQLQSALVEMEPWKAEPPALKTNLLGRFLEVSNKFALWKGLGEEWTNTLASLAGAQTLEDYLRFLDQLAHSPFASTAQRDGAAEIDRLKVDLSTFLGEVLLPKDRMAWDSLTNLDAWRTNLMPEKATDEENQVYINLRDDKNMRDIYSYQLIAFRGRVNQSHRVFVQGSITGDPSGRQGGLVYDPSASPIILRFSQQYYDAYNWADIQKGPRLPECESFERLGLGELIDPNTGNYLKPILQLLDQLNKETNASAVFRAIVTLKLFDLARPRPEEWGLQWCPGAAQHLQGLTDLGAMDLRSGDWMVPSQSVKYEAPLRKYFESAGAVSLERQARFLQHLVGETCRAGFTFAGFVDGDGRLVLQPLHSPATEYWGWGNRPPSAVLLFRKGSGGEALNRIAEPLPFTPLFVFKDDCRKLLKEAEQAVPYPAGQAVAILLPLFAQPRE